MSGVFKILLKNRGAQIEDNQIKLSPELNAARKAELVSQIQPQLAAPAPVVEPPAPGTVEVIPPKPPSPAPQPVIVQPPPPTKEAPTSAPAAQRAEMPFDIVRAILERGAGKLSLEYARTIQKGFKP